MILNSLEGLECELKEKIVKVPELGKGYEILVREMDGARMTDFQKYSEQESERTDEHLLIACMVDEQGTQIAAHEQAPALAKAFNYEVRQRLLDAVVEIHPYLFDKKKAGKQN